MQFASAALFAIASASLVASASLPVGPRTTGPLAKRAAAGQEDIDTVILNYALTLEHLENAFYRDTLPSAGAFSKAGYPDWVRERFVEIGGHEKSHVEFLTKALGANATAECKYNFGVTDPKSFVATSALLEGVGVSAYLGAAQNITNPAYLTAAGSILTTESRHSAWVQSSVEKGDAFPAAYDTPAGTFSQVYSLAAPLITSCPPTNPKLPVTAFPALKASPATPVGGTEVTLTADGIQDGQYLGFIGAAGATQFVEVKNKKATIPKDIGYGRIYAILVKNNKAITDDATVAGPIALDIPLSPASKAAALYQ